MKPAGEHDRLAVGVGVAACAVCCAGPILAFLGGLGVAGLLNVVVLGTVGLGLAALTLAVAGRPVARRRRAACALAGHATVPVAAPTRRPVDLARTPR